MSEFSEKRSPASPRFVEDYDVDLTPVASPEPFGMSEFSEKRSPASPRFAATPDQTPLVAPMETQAACRQLLASFQEHFGGAYVLDQPPMPAPMPAPASSAGSMPNSPEPMMQQQPLQMQPVMMQQQPMQQQQVMM